MITKKELFFKELGISLVPHGFLYQKSKNAFSKKEKGAEYVIEFEVWPQFIQVMPQYFISIKDVEDIKKKALGNYYQLKSTIGTEAFWFDRKAIKSTYWTDTEENVLKAVAEQASIFTNYGLPFFEKFSSIAMLDQELNKEGSTFDFGINDFNKCCVSVIAAYLSKNPELKNILARNKEYLKAKERPGVLGISEYLLLEGYINDLVRA